MPLLVVSGVTRSPTSLGDLLQAHLGGTFAPELDEVPSVSVPMVGDQMMLRVRTGHVLDGTNEAARAQDINDEVLLIDVLNIPIKLNDLVSGECAEAITLVPSWDAYRLRRPHRHGERA